MIPPLSFFSVHILEEVHNQPLSDSPLDLSGDISSFWSFCMQCWRWEEMNSLEKAQLGEAMIGTGTVKGRVASLCRHDAALTSGACCCLMGAWHGTCNSKCKTALSIRVTDRLPQKQPSKFWEGREVANWGRQVTQLRVRTWAGQGQDQEKDCFPRCCNCTLTESLAFPPAL